MRINYSSDVKRKLRKHKIRSFDKLIHDQSRRWLVENFSEDRRTHPVNVSMLMRNIVWQLRERIITGEKPPLRELLRTFWYMYIKPTLGRAGALSERSDSQYRQMIQQISNMVKKYKLMEYKDIGFRDNNRAHRLVGENTNIIIFAEKQGEFDFLEEIHKKFRVSIITFGGKPSVVNSEYFVDEIKENISLNRSFYLFGITDFDPDGLIIRNSFLENLNRYGINNIKLTDLIHPDMLTEEETKFSRYPLSTGSKKKKRLVKEWRKEISRKNFKNMKCLKEGSTYYGLESEAVSAARINKALQEKMLPLLGRPEDYLKEYELKNLNEKIRKLILYKMTGGEKR